MIDFIKTNSFKINYGLSSLYFYMRLSYIYIRSYWNTTLKKCKYLFRTRYLIAAFSFYPQYLLYIALSIIVKKNHWVFYRLPPPKRIGSRPIFSCLSRRAEQEYMCLRSGGPSPGEIIEVKVENGRFSNAYNF